MNERELLIVRNMLNGVDAREAAAALESSEEHALEVFGHVMRMVNVAALHVPTEDS
jgi:hypothetical protein